MSETKNKLASILSEKDLSTNKSVNLIKPINIKTSKTKNNNNIDRLSETFEQVKINKANNLNPLSNIKNIKIRNKSNNEFRQTKRRIQTKDEIIAKDREIQSRNNFLLNKNNNNNIKTIKEDIKEPTIFFYRIIKFGNDDSTIKKCFEFRENWQLAPLSLKNNEVNFLWAPLSSQIKFGELNIDSNITINTMTTHFEFHRQLSNKLKMFKNLLIFCEDNNMDLFKIVPLTILIEYEGPEFLRQFSSFTYIFNNINDLLGDPGKQRENKRKYRNYFYIDNESENKIGLRTSLYIPRNHYNGKNLWLLKAMNLNRGLAIKIVDSVEMCESTIRSFYQGGIFKSVKEKGNDETEDRNKKVFFELPKIVKKNGKDKAKPFKNDHQFCLYRQIDYYSLIRNSRHERKKHYQSNKIILQKYIEQPLLYNGRKFDVRMWVLLSYDMKVYVFKEGHLKATSYKYDLENKNAFVHLTNYSVQKYSDNFSKFERGNEISFDEFQLSLQKDYNLNNINVRKEIFNSIKNVIGISMKSVKKSINENNRKGCFEIFGYDFMFDKDLNPYLIEINTNPGLEISSPLISTLVPRMIDDALRLTIDVIFNTKYIEERYVDGKYSSPFHVDGYNDDENLFDFVCDLNEKLK